MIKKYFKTLYDRTMRESYDLAHSEVIAAVKNGGKCLDCGASRGRKYEYLASQTTFESGQYFGIEWSQSLVDEARAKDINIVQGDLNQLLPYEDDQFDCVFGLSVLEHLFFPCRYINEAKRVLKKDGVLILLTPNISTFFTAALILMGKMPSSGPHPDSMMLMKNEEVIKVSESGLHNDVESDQPVHRHLVVFSYRVLKKYLEMLGFEVVTARGFGLYPFPAFTQGVLEKLDPYHCHQMVFVARKK